MPQRRFAVFSQMRNFELEHQQRNHDRKYRITEKYNSLKAQACFWFRFIHGGALKKLDTLDARKPANSSIAIQNQLAGFVSILFKVFKSRRQHDPPFLPSATEIAAQQVGKFPPETLNVLGSGKQPDPIR